VARSRDSVIDKKFGSVVRLRRVKLRMSQSELGAALGVTFQQIQKYEQGKNAIASTRIPDLCRALELTPNDLFGVSAKMDGELTTLSSWTMRISAEIGRCIACHATSGRRGPRHRAAATGAARSQTSAGNSQFFTQTKRQFSCNARPDHTTTATVSGLAANAAAKRAGARPDHSISGRYSSAHGKFED
jgi:transcriptional regulator with XRE-family HTH domain